MKYNNARGGGDEGTVHDNKQYIGGARKKPGGERRWGKEEMQRREGRSGKGSQDE